MVAGGDSRSSQRLRRDSQLVISGGGVGIRRRITISYRFAYKRDVPYVFFSFSYRLPSRLAVESITNTRKDSSMTNMALFAELHSEGQTIILVTHEHDIAMYAQREIVLRDGMISSDRVRQALVPA